MRFAPVLLGAVVCWAASAADIPINPGERAPAIALRKRIHVNPLIAAPDTMEYEYGVALSTGGDFTLPAMFKYTPEGHHIYWGRTEFSVGFDSLASTTDPGHRVTNFGDRMTFAATCVVRDGDKLDFALAPQATVLLRGDSGARVGATAIARYDAGRSSTGVTVTWTGATAASPTNPASTMDVGAGFGYRLMPSGALGHLTPHVNLLYEKSTGVERQVSVYEGVEYQITEKVAVDFSAQHQAAWGGQTDHQVVIGLTVDTPRLHHK